MHAAVRRPAAAPVGIVLAAGEGRRMGRPKALVHDPDETSWLSRAADTLAAAGCAPVVVVLGARADEAMRVLGDARRDPAPRVVVATDWKEGIGASLRRGLDEAAATGASTAVVTLVDLPDVGPEVVARVLSTVGDDPASLGRAAYRGLPGHPVVLGRDHWSGVADSAAGDRGARDYLASHDVVHVECGDLATGADRDLPDPGPAVPPQGHPG